jgi:predicted RNA binding protein YcfA (HicA-like mRNA interferase family)
MSRLPRLKGGEILAALVRAGFIVVRIIGSHHRVRHPDGRVTTVPVHGSEIIGPGLLSSILRDCDLSAGDLQSFLDS